MKLRLYSIARAAYYANCVLDALEMETLPVAFWRGLWNGTGERPSDPLKVLLTPQPMNVTLVVKLYKSLDTEGKAKLLNAFNANDRRILLSELTARKVI